MVYIMLDRLSFPQLTPGTRLTAGSTVRRYLTKARPRIEPESSNQEASALHTSAYEC
jgi:hypothetical protein